MKALLLLVVVTLGLSPARARAGDEYAVDPVHSSVTFMVSHLGLAHVHGRFNEFSGSFTVDKDDPGKSSFAMSMKIDSIDTNNKKRDDHLKSGDFFNARQFPLLTFQSTAVKAIEGGFEVTGDLTMHGVKKEVTLRLRGGKTVEFPKGMMRTGFNTTLTVKRSDHGMKTALDMLGDEVHIAVGVEAVKK